MSDRLAVNEHYLGHLVDTGERRGVEATEDIVSGNGVKLVAKGAAIDARTRERLLQHKLLKPLESCTRVIGGVASRPMDAIADRLMHEHQLLASLCRDEQAATVLQGFRRLQLSPQIDTLLTVYADSGETKLAHVVGVSLIAGALQLKLHPAARLAPVLTAALMHDIGELYIDPAILRQQGRLTPDQWRHVVAHPVIAAGLLRDLPGGSGDIAEAVLQHHERLDGLGLPLGVAGPRLSGMGQILAMAELMMETLEAGPSPSLQAAARLKLMQAQFERPLLDWVSRCCRDSAGAGAKSATSANDTEGAQGAHSESGAAEPAAAAGTDALQPRISSLGARLAAQLDFQARWSTRAHESHLAEMLSRLERRLRAVDQAMASAGLGEALHGLQGLQGLHLGANEIVEVGAIVSELEGRLSESAYELHWRATQMQHPDAEPLRRDFETSVRMPLAA